VRILALDVGSKRVGVAISDEFGWTAQPLPSIDAMKAGEPFRTAAAIVREHDVTEVVVGLPLNMDGTDSRQTAGVREFAQRLRSSLPRGVSVELWDERLTSRQSERAMGAMMVRRTDRKQRSDQMAAQLILQGYLERQRGAGTCPPDNDTTT